MATSSSVEAEQKFDAVESTPLPALDAIDGVGRVGEPVSHTLDATYFDTRQLALASHGITLRRRTGGHDAGWHLKLPLGPGKRTEIHAPLGSADTVPLELMDRILAYTRAHAVGAVATLHTDRKSYALYGSDGERLADFVDDHVRAHVTVGAEHQLQWREWEVELAASDGNGDALLDTLTSQLSAAGATPSKRSSKLATALGEDWPAPGKAGQLPPMDDAAGKGSRKATGKKPAATPILSYLQRQLAGLLLQDSHVRLGRDDSVHQMRALTRRIRSVLHTYRELFVPEPVRELESGLKSLAETLGRYRDTEVLHQRLRNALDDLPEYLVLGPLQDELEQRMVLRADTAKAAIHTRLTSPGYFHLLDDLEEFIESPALSEKGKAPARKTTAKLVNKAVKRLRKRHDTAVGAAVGPHRDEALHEVRKSAKKLRFAAAAAESIHGKRAAKLGKAAHKVQSILGTHHDSVVARQELLDLGSTPGLESSGFTYGVLHAQESTASEAAERKYLAKSAKALKLRLKK
ncbi:CYTH and CHAD domain-containing protein [Paenarthrobacter sp. NPDC089316]|uniref:CYTH and CHAD domain-containing protein n=1 Tax=unclassified Paenarthrobacter TaxID=2634190 RepID=UPI00343BF9C0